MILHCFVFEDAGLDETLAAMERSSAPWIGAITTGAMWAQRDWYPRLLEAIGAGCFDVLVPLVNEPAPDWQAAGPAGDDIAAHRALARGCAGGVLDVTGEPARAVGAAAVVRRELARHVLGAGLASAHARAAELGKVGVVNSIYVVRHARF
jgi:hypothetical protein